MTLPRNGLRGEENTEVARVWKSSMAESEEVELRKRLVSAVFQVSFQTVTSFPENCLLTKDRQADRHLISVRTDLEKSDFQ